MFALCSSWPQGPRTLNARRDGSAARVLLAAEADGTVDRNVQAFGGAVANSARDRARVRDPEKWTPVFG
jgi:hypothetical protein